MLQTSLDDEKQCPLCGRLLVPGPTIDAHHLVPRSHGGKETVTLHRVCHTKIHSVLSEKELNDYYHTLSRLRKHPEIAKFLKWVRKKHPEFIDGHVRHRRRRKNA